MGGAGRLISFVAIAKSCDAPIRGKWEVKAILRRPIMDVMEVIEEKMSFRLLMKY
jgi:hypothetical protein